MNCCHCDCYNCGYSLWELDALLYNLKLELIKLSEDNLPFLKFKYKKSTDEEIVKISFYIYSLQYVTNRLSADRTVCLCPDELGKLYSKAEETLGSIKNIYELEDRKDVTIDLTKELEWIKNNPYCSSREDWERLSFVLCRDLKVEITATELKCNFTFDVVKEEITCDVLTALSIAEKACKLNVIIKRTDEQCKAEWKVFLEQYPGTINFKTYKSALNNHNLTFEAIKAIYDAGLTLGLNKLGTCYLKTNLTSYDLSDISFSNLITSQSINSSNLISTTKQTDLKKFLTDYNSITLNNECQQ